MLLIKGTWAKLPNYRIIDELLKIIEAKLSNEWKNGDNCSCLRNESNNKIVYNTGLIDNYGNDILVMAKLDEYGNISSREVVKSKTQLRRMGFQATDVAPVSFYKNRQDLILQASEEEFDLENIRRIRHITEERRWRFPENVNNMSDDELFTRIRESLKFDLKMIVRNPYWSAPFYNIKQNEIQHLLPLFTGSLSDEAQLALVIGRGEYFYEIKTVLPLEDAYANASCLASPPSTWLENCLKSNIDYRDV